MGKEAKYIVRLSSEERSQLSELVSRGRVAATVRQRALILLKADVEGPNWSDEQIAEVVLVSLSTVHRIRQRCVEEGLEQAIERKPSPQRQYRKLDGAQEAKLIALACSKPPTGRVCWTMQLLADKMIELEIVDAISEETVRNTLKKTSSNLGRKNTGCCPPNTTPTLFVQWKTCSTSTSFRTIQNAQSSVSMNSPSS